MEWRQRTWFYYIGWQRAIGLPYTLFAGAAVSDAGRVFHRVQRTPVLDRIGKEPFSHCAPCVLVDCGWRRLMFYNGNRHGETGFGLAQLEAE